MAFQTPDTHTRAHKQTHTFLIKALALHVAVQANWAQVVKFGLLGNTQQMKRQMSH